MFSARQCWATMQRMLVMHLPGVGDPDVGSTCGTEGVTSCDGACEGEGLGSGSLGVVVASRIGSDFFFFVL